MRFLVVRGTSRAEVQIVHYTPRFPEKIELLGFVTLGIF
jgi:hypothetical protein